MKIFKNTILFRSVNHTISAKIVPSRKMQNKYTRSLFISNYEFSFHSGRTDMGAHTTHFIND